MTYRVRSWAGNTPLPGMDVTTGSARVAAHEVIERASRYRTFDDVSLIVPGQRAMKGDELRLWTERVLGE